MPEPAALPPGIPVPEGARPEPEPPLPPPASPPPALPAPPAPFSLRDRFTWGVFKFTHKAIGKGGAANPGWQVICPFHAVSEKTKCTRFLTLSELSLRGEDEVIRCLQMWALDAPNHNRARWHQSEPSIPGLLPPADVVDEILRASRIDSMPEGFVLKDDVELTRLAAVAFSARGRGRGRANAPGAGGGRAGRGAGRGRTGASTGAASSSAGPSASSASAGIAVAGAALAAAGDIVAVVPAVPVEHSSSSNGSNSSSTSSDSSSSQELAA